MFLLSSVVFVVLLQSATGDPYCSLNDTHIDCVPCSEDCVNQTCFICPKKCGKVNNCKNVCESTCLDQTCEYVKGGNVPVCTKGCIDGHAGKRCQEYCSEGCKTCDQATGKKCTSCFEGLEGQYCNLTIVSSTHTIPSSSSIMRECSEECEFCKEDGVVCEKCTNETKCQDPCGCNGLRLTTDSQQFQPTSTSAHDSMSTHSQTAFADAAAAAATTAAAGAGAVAVVVVVICIATICMYRNMRRNIPQPLEMEQNTSQVDIPGTRRESDPYAFIVVVDRDCVPEHYLQAAMVTAPQLVPNV